MFRPVFELWSPSRNHRYTQGRYYFCTFQGMIQLSLNTNFCHEILLSCFLLGATDFDVESKLVIEVKWFVGMKRVDELKIFLEVKLVLGIKRVQEY